MIRVPVVKGHTLVGMVARRDVVFAYVKARVIYWGEWRLVTEMPERA